MHVLKKKIRARTHARMHARKDIFSSVWSAGPRSGVGSTITANECCRTASTGLPEQGRHFATRQRSPLAKCFIHWYLSFHTLVSFIPCTLVSCIHWYAKSSA